MLFLATCGFRELRASTWLAEEGLATGAGVGLSKTASSRGGRNPGGSMSHCMATSLV